MSYLATAWASMSAPITDVNEFAVLMMLAEKAGDDGCSAFPSRQTVSERTRVDPRTVLRALQRMEERRLIAKGDQRAAEYLRKDRRPIVYDLLIPVSWYSPDQLAKVNADRVRRGLEPLSRKLRPDIEQPPEKPRRSDLDKPNPRRRRKDRAPESPHEEIPRGVSETSREETSRGVSETGTGCLEDTNGVSQRHPRKVLEPVLEPSLSAGASETAPTVVADAVTGERDQQQGQDAADVVVDAYATALGRPMVNGSKARLRQQAAELLAAKYPVGWLAARAREMAPQGWTDLAKHVEHSKVPVQAGPAGAAAPGGERRATPAEVEALRVRIMARGSGL